MTRFISPALLIAGLSMALIVVFSNWLMQGGVVPEAPQAFTWLNRVTGQDPLNGVFLYGQFTFPLAFLITDIINRLFGPDRAGHIISVGVVFGGLASFYFAGAQIAVASIVAFTVGQVLDVLVFQRLRQMRWYIAPLVSSLLASLIDTLIFYALAFGLLNSLGFASVDMGVKAFVALGALFCPSGLLLQPSLAIVRWPK